MTVNVVGEVDLSLSSRELHKTLAGLWRSEYQSNDRIIAYYYGDTYEYKDLPGKQLRQFVDCLTLLDIPTFFVTVVTSNTNFAQEVRQITAETIAHTLVEQEFVQTYSQASETFCVLPWMHLYIGTDSNVLPCCMGDKDYPLGSIINNTIADIANSDSARQLRLNMLNGVKSKECSQCYHVEATGLPSYRQSANIEWAQFVDRKDQTAPNGSIEFEAHYIDIRLNNICNLKCRYCSGHYSSSIAQEEKEMFGSSAIIYETLSQEQRDQALENIWPHMANVEKIYFAGGEPLITAEHYKILDHLIAIGKTDIEITYNTNFTKLTYKGRSILDLWKQFSNVTVGASLDAMGRVAEYARYGTRWQDMDKNFALLKKHCPHVHFKITSTASMLTVESLMLLQKDWYENKQIPIDDFAVSLLYSPDTLSLQILPAEQKDRIGQLINKHINWLTAVGATSPIEQWQNVMTYMYADDRSHLLPEFVKLNSLKDTRRKESFITIYPKFKNLYRS